MIFRVPEMTDRQRQAAATLDGLRESMKYALQAPKQWTGLLRRDLAAKAIRGSNSIEGYRVTFDEAVAVVEGEEFEAGDATRRAVRGYQLAMTYILRLSDDPHFTLNEELLRSLHYMMICHDQEKNPGRWRPGHIYVRREPTGEVVYEGPDADLVPGLMRELVAQIRDADESIHTTVLAAMAHLNLVMIHPFSDGNGRMGRALQTLVLARDGILSPTFASIEEYLGANTQRYYDILAEVGGGRWLPERDAAGWIDFCLAAHLQQAVTVGRRLRDTARLWDELEEELSRRGLNDRMISALYEAAVGLTVRASRYRDLADVSAVVASRDLAVLVQEGFLTPIGEKRGRRYVASDRLKEIRRRTREDRVPASEIFRELNLPL